MEPTYTDFVLSFTAEQRLLRVRFLMYLSVGFLGLMTYASVQLVEMFSTGIEPNGNPISAGEVSAFLVICQLAGWAFVIGMHLYGRCYVLRIFTNRESGQQVYETVGWFCRVPWFISADEKEACRYRRGETRALHAPGVGVSRMSVDAPYYSQRVRFRRLPFVIDANGTFIDA